MVTVASFVLNYAHDWQKTRNPHIKLGVGMQVRRGRCWFRWEQQQQSCSALQSCCEDRRTPRWGLGDRDLDRDPRHPRRRLSPSETTRRLRTDLREEEFVFFFSSCCSGRPTHYILFQLPIKWLLVPRQAPPPHLPSLPCSWWASYSSFFVFSGLNGSDKTKLN